MANLYEINEAILNCVDIETGEIIDAECLEALEMERTAKIENIVLWVKNLLAEAAAYKAEKEAFAEREKQAAAKAERLKMYLTAALGGERFTTEKCAVSFRKSKSVEVDETQLPKEWCTEKITYTPNKIAIKKAIGAGEKVPGARLMEWLNIQIK